MQSTKTDSVSSCFASRTSILDHHVVVFAALHRRCNMHWPLQYGLSMPKDRKLTLLPTDHHLLVTLRATTYCRVVLGPGALAATAFDAACHRRDDHRHARFAQAVVTDHTCCITPFRLTTIYLSRFARSLFGRVVFKPGALAAMLCIHCRFNKCQRDGKGRCNSSTVYLVRQTAIYEDAVKHYMLSLYQRTCYASRNPTHSVAGC